MYQSICDKLRAIMCANGCYVDSRTLDPSRPLDSKKEQMTAKAEKR